MAPIHTLSSESQRVAFQIKIKLQSYHSCLKSSKTFYLSQGKGYSSYSDNRRKWSAGHSQCLPSVAVNLPSITLPQLCGFFAVLSTPQVSSCLTTAVPSAWKCFPFCPFVLSLHLHQVSALMSHCNRGPSWVPYFKWIFFPDPIFPVLTHFFSPRR